MIGPLQPSLYLHLLEDIKGNLPYIRADSGYSIKGEGGLISNQLEDNMAVQSNFIWPNQAQTQVGWMFWLSYIKGTVYKDFDSQVLFIILDADGEELLTCGEKFENFFTD